MDADTRTGKDRSCTIEKGLNRKSIIRIAWLIYGVFSHNQQGLTGLMVDEAVSPVLLNYL
jgi:hypothetical protein